MGVETVLLPSLARAESWRKREADGLNSLADGSSALFGVTIATFDSWIADLWELYGDGRLLVDGTMRRMLVRRALQMMVEDDTWDVEISSGMVGAVAECARRAIGVPLFDEAVSDIQAGKANPNLDEAERHVLLTVACYMRLLRECGLVEAGEAAALIARDSDTVFRRPATVLMEEASPLDWRKQAFFDSCEPLSLDMHIASGADGIGQVPSDVHLQFAYPSGPSAQAGLAADAVRAFFARREQVSSECDGNGWGSARYAASVVIACKDPLAFHGALEHALVEEGIRLAVQGRIPFARTDFGRAFLAMHRCLRSDPWDKAALIDVLLSPFAGVSKRDAYRMDYALRQNRLVDREEAIASLRAAYEEFSQLEELASDPDADILVGVFEQIAQARVSCSAAWRSEQLAAISALRAVTSAARATGQDIDAVADELSRALVSVSFESSVSEDAGEHAAPGAPDVLVVDQAAAADLGPHACALLIVADLTSDDYPVADKDNAVETLLFRLGLKPYDSALSEERRRFTALIGLPAERLVLMRPLNDAAAAPAYPCIVLDELIDSYRDDPTATDDVDNKYRIPEALQAGLMARSEDALFENAVAAAVGDCQEMQSPKGRDRDRSCMCGAVLLPRRIGGGLVLDRACPSPSAIESYLECPGKWFIDRRLKAGGIDEEFGPLAKGSFAHEALQAFYKQFQDGGVGKVRADNLKDARCLMQTVLDELEAEQYGMEPGSNRLVPATELEKRDMAAFKRQILDYLDYEALLLPTYRPAYFEYAIEPDRRLEYAGYLLTGRIDRIDVDDAGHAVVIDYKGSIDEAHCIAGKTAQRMGKVQTRIYAQAVKRALGLDVVGAFYVTYGRTPQIAGAFDPCMLDVAHLPGIKASACACAAADDDALQEGLLPDTDLSSLTFSHMLDATEEVVGRAIARMQRGDVSPAPETKEVCRYCVAPDCEKRGDA